MRCRTVAPITATRQLDGQLVQPNGVRPSTSVGTDRHILRRRSDAETNAVPVHGTLFSARHYVRMHKAQRLSTSKGGDG